MDSRTCAAARRAQDQPFDIWRRAERMACRCEHASATRGKDGFGIKLRPAITKAASVAARVPAILDPRHAAACLTNPGKRLATVFPH
ncbi:MAG: hypothetical protein JJT95_05140 [Pararhodobacter sp.]|nr:hypothetical protein [Pararhodobacter sp.]